MALDNLHLEVIRANHDDLVQVGIGFGKVPYVTIRNFVLFFGSTILLFYKEKVIINHIFSLINHI